MDADRNAPVRAYRMTRPGPSAPMMRVPSIAPTVPHPAVYIMSSYSRCLYVGVTGDLVRRVGQHRDGTGSDFAARYRTRRLVWFELHPTPISAIAREKELKRWKRARKVALVSATNAAWRDLARRWPEIELLDG